MTAAPVPVVGYTGVEHALVVGSDLIADRTSLLAEHATPDTGRVGGCAAYVAAGLTDRGVPSAVISWTGADPLGRRIRNELAGDRVVVTGLAEAGQTAETWMIYGPSGATWCIHDAADGFGRRLTAGQAELIAAAPWCVITVGPPAATHDVLDLLGPDQYLLWSVKSDQTSTPSALVRRLVDRADVLVCSQTERNWLREQLGAELAERVRPGCLVVETQGAQGLGWQRDGASGWLTPAERIDVADATGAGDWAVAGLLAALLAGHDPDEAIRWAANQAGRLLRARAEQKTGVTNEQGRG